MTEAGPDPTKPLAGIRIVEAAQMIAGPLGTSILSDQGAEVIKIEPPNGDRMRTLGDIRNGMGSVFHNSNRGKKSLSIDTKNEAGLAAVLKLVDTADVFVQNFRPGVAERLGLGYEALAARNPDLIYVSVSGFGPTGPYHTQRVFDFVVQGVSGWASAEGIGGPPQLTKNLVMDKATAYTVSQAITAALLHRATTGNGQAIEVTMLEAGLQFLWPDGAWSHTLLGDDITSMPPLAANYEVWKTKDGYVTLNIVTRSGWPDICEALNPAWLEDPRFIGLRDRMANGEELNREVAGTIAALTTEQALAALHASGVPAGPVVDMEDLQHNAQIAADRSLVEHVSASIGPIREPRPAVRFAATAPADPEPAPLQGQDNGELLASLGYSKAEVADLVADGVLHQPEARSFP